MVYSGDLRVDGRDEVMLNGHQTWGGAIVHLQVARAGLELAAEHVEDAFQRTGPKHDALLVVAHRGERVLYRVGSPVSSVAPVWGFG